MTHETAVFRFRAAMLIFILGLVVSGITAFPLLAELKIISRLMGLEDATIRAADSGLAHWIVTVRLGLEETYSDFPWMAYGTDWLAFGHMVIALFFIHPSINPGASRPVIYAGLVACGLVVPFAFVCGSLRSIPIYWQLIDCSFGVFGSIPLLYCLHLLRAIHPPVNERL